MSKTRSQNSTQLPLTSLTPSQQLPLYARLPVLSYDSSPTKNFPVPLTMLTCNRGIIWSHEIFALIAYAHTTYLDLNVGVPRRARSLIFDLMSSNVIKTALISRNVFNNYLYIA